MVTRVFRLTFHRPVLVPGSGGGYRRHMTYAAIELADALRLYRQDYPDGLEPLLVEDTTP